MDEAQHGPDAAGQTVDDGTPVDAGDKPLRLDFAAVSDVGRHRKENQDSGYAGSSLLVIADGVGGAAYGDVASATAVHLLRRLYEPRTSDQGDEMLTALAGAVHRVHDKLAEMVEHDRELDGTSTTVTAAMFDGHRLGFAHVGDSRAYLLRDGRVEQVTHDHTFVQTLIDDGRITEEEARVHPHRNIILRAVDGVRDAEPDLFHVQLRPGDRVMLCSDGCSGAVDDEEIGTLLGAGSVESAAHALVHAALENGTTDNVTVVVAEAQAAPAAAAAAAAEAEAAPVIVGAAAAQPRRGGMLGWALFRRTSDTGELEPVPAAPIDPEELRYLPRAPRRHAGVRRALFVLVPLLLVLGGIAAAYTWTQNQYYVSDDGDFVAIYQGVQMDLPGVTLSSVFETDTLKVADLPEFDQQQVRDGIVANDYSDAKRIVGNLEQQVPDCPDTTPGSGGTTGTKKDQNGTAGDKSTNRNDTSTGTKSGTQSGTRSATPRETPSESPSDTTKNNQDNTTNNDGTTSGSDPCRSTP